MAVVLGIETSCDETGIGIVEDGRLLGDALASSMAEHVRFGGVVPEIAARAHLPALGPCTKEALAKAGVTLAGVDAVAVTTGPGLASSLHVGIAAAKGYAVALGKPLYAVHHLAGHAAVDVLEHGTFPERYVALIVSGGHTSLLAIADLARDPIEHLGDTMDDAAGEAFDKVARLIGLPYPGGPSIAKAAVGGDRTAIDFPRALTGPGDPPYAFSFSGLKTAVARWVHGRSRRGEAVPVADVAASFQEAVVDVLTAKAIRACCERGADTLLVVGGVAANARLREVAAARCDAAGITLRIPPPRLCTDNGAMIAAVGDLLIRGGQSPATLDVPARPSAVLTRASLAH